MDGVQKPFRLRKEHCFQLRGRRDPVARSNYDRRSIKVIEAKLREVRGDGLHYGTTFDGIRCKQDLSCLSNRLGHGLIVERIRGPKIHYFSGQAEL